MSQVDKLIYMPLLVWFVILFIYLYITVFVFFLPAVYKWMKIRKNYFNKCLNNNKWILRLFIRLSVLVLGWLTPFALAEKQLIIAKLATTSQISYLKRNI